MGICRFFIQYDAIRDRWYRANMSGKNGHLQGDRQARFGDRAGLVVDYGAGDSLRACVRVG